MTRVSISLFPLAFPPLGACTFPMPHAAAVAAVCLPQRCSFSLPCLPPSTSQHKQGRDLCTNLNFLVGCLLLSLLIANSSNCVWIIMVLWRDQSAVLPVWLLPVLPLCCCHLPPPQPQRQTRQRQTWDPVWTCALPNRKEKAKRASP
jgi:hypothetical protein